MLKLLLQGLARNVMLRAFFLHNNYMITNEFNTINQNNELIPLKDEKLITKKNTFFCLLSVFLILAPASIILTVTGTNPAH